MADLDAVPDPVRISGMVGLPLAEERRAVAAKLAVEFVSFRPSAKDLPPPGLRVVLDIASHIEAFILDGTLPSGPSTEES